MSDDTAVLTITNTPRDYSWGSRGGISRVLGWTPTDALEAELWLGSHPLSPSRPTDASAPWPDLATWEEQEGAELPFLFKVLAAERPLSLQAHPTERQAREGFAREDALGIPRNDPIRNYKDPHAKPELIVAAEDGFHALCGFRPVNDTRRVIRDLARVHNDPVLAQWCARLGAEDGLRDTLYWLLSGSPDVEHLVAVLGEIAATDPVRWSLLHGLTATYPTDPGVAVAVLLNEVILQRGQALWLPAGNIHAYLSGVGMELMGPSDNVLRGGFTNKHVDIEELERILDFVPSPPPLLAPLSLSPSVHAYRPNTVPSGRDVPFELLSVTGEASVRTASAAIAIVLDGEFRIAVDPNGIRADESCTSTDGMATSLGRGGVAFISRPSAITVSGGGSMYLATGV